MSSGSLQATKGVLNTLADLLTGPGANPIDALDGALQAAGDLLNLPDPGRVPLGKFVGNLNKAVGLLGKLGA